MKRNRKKADRLWIGLVGGIIMFIIMVVVFFRSNGWNLQEDFSGVMKYLAKDSFAALRFAMLCILPNSMLTFLSYRFELWDTYKGFMVITMLSFIPFVLFLL
jgi:hypothetical protein